MTGPSPDTPAQTGAEERPLVLIVDDSEQNLKLARDVLRAAGFRTLEATDGVGAIALASEHMPNVVLMDLHLPDLSGTDVARKLAETTRTAGIPIVALSAQPLEGSGDWLLAAGFAGFLEKPVRVTEFPDEVRRYCVDVAERSIPRERPARAGPIPARAGWQHGGSNAGRQA